MNKWFTGVKTVAQLRTKYRELLKKYHPDNDGGSVEVTQEVNAEYDRLFAALSQGSSEDGHSSTEEKRAGDEAFKAILNEIINLDMEIEVIGGWIWCFKCFAVKDRLKELGFKYAPKKKAWTWHYGEYKRHHGKEVSLDEIRMKYGSQTVHSKSKRYALD